MTVVIKNIFDAIAESPEEAEDLKLRSSLMNLVKDELASQGYTGKKAQRHLQMDDESFGHFKQGAIGEFSPGRLAHMLSMLGRKVSVSIDKAA